MKLISILGSVVALVVASATVGAQDFTAGKTPAQLFSSDCSECHRSPAGLGKSRDQRALTGFLREHYTTKPETAGALATYVSGFAGATPPPEPTSRRGAVAARRVAEPDEESRSAAKPSDEQSARRRRTVSMSGDGEKRRPKDDAASRGLNGLASSGGREPVTLLQRVNPRVQAPAAEPAGRSGNPPASGQGAASASAGIVDMLDRLKAYASSGQDFEAIAAEAAKAHSDNAAREVVAAPGEPGGPSLPIDGGSDLPAAVQTATPSVILAPTSTNEASTPTKSDPASSLQAATDPSALAASSAPAVDGPTAGSAAGAVSRGASGGAVPAAGANDTAKPAALNPLTPSPSMGIGGTANAAPAPIDAMPRPSVP
jgi:hypothetical protein